MNNLSQNEHNTGLVENITIKYFTKFILELYSEMS
jgi:hypothetical protein